MARTSWTAPCRAAVTTVAAAAAAVALAPAAWRAVTGLASWGGLAPDPADTFGAVTLGVGALCAAWIALTSALLLTATGAQALGAQVTRLRAAADAMAPRMVRRLVVAGMGAALGLAPQVAVADEVDLGWSAGPEDRATERDPAQPEPGVVTPEQGLVLVSNGVPAVEPAIEPVSTATVTVAPGDSLWALTREHLATTSTLSPTDAEIAAAWPAVWAENRAVIGSDPGLLHPGQVLTLPADLALVATPPTTPPLDHALDTDDLEETR